MNKVDHIHHLEDLALFSYQKAIDAYIAVSYDKFKIKYDGAPALIFGLSDGRFFLSTKSYFNKTPKINYSIADIYANHSARSPGLTDKLVEIFPKMKEFYRTYKCLYKDSHIFQGDLLFSSHPEDGIFTPNTITYKIPNLNNKTYDLGLAIHTRYDANGDSYQMTDFCDEGTIFNNVYIPPKEVANHLTIDEIAPLVRAVNLLEKEDYNKLTIINTTDPVRDINYLVRNNIEINEQSLKSVLYKYNYSNKIINFYLELLKYKQILIKHLDNRCSYDNLKMFIGDKQTGHEGYVVRCGGSLIKLVNRETFSYSNFEKNG